MYSGYNRLCNELTALSNSAGVHENLVHRTRFKKLKKSFSEMIADVDLNGNGKVEFEEFLIMMNSKTKRLDSDNGIDIAFQIFDSNKDGLISADELK